MRMQPLGNSPFCKCVPRQHRQAGADTDKFCTDCGGKLKRRATPWIDFLCGVGIGLIALIVIGCRSSDNEISWRWFACGVGVILLIGAVVWGL